MIELIFLLSADLDIQRAYDFHENWQEGRGDVFMRHLDAAFGQLRAFPESGPAVNRKYRRLLVPGFPFGNFYAIERRDLVVAAVLDSRQDPKEIARRLR